MIKIKNLVVGAGFSGAVTAERIALELNEPVLVIDKENHIAGNSFDYKDKNNIFIHKYGSHIFHTQSEKVWGYLKKFTDFNTYMHKVFAVIDGIETTIPFNINTLYDVFPKCMAQKLEIKLLKIFEYNSKVPILEFQNQDDTDLKFLAQYIYEKVFLNYTTKQWGLTPEELDKTVTSRVPVYISRDDRYFQDKYQGIPLQGYSKVIENILKHPNIEVKLNTDFSEIKKNIEYEKIFYTGSIDEFFEYKFGILPYRSLTFMLEEHEREFYQNNSVVNYPNNYDFTRIHEYKHFLNDKSHKTVIAKEYPEEFELKKNQRYYPILNEYNQSLYKQYKEEAKKWNNVYFLGRLGDYKYYDIDKAVLRALELFEEVFKQ
jgi:UDP-galactopyranose mutase